MQNKRQSSPPQSSQPPSSRPVWRTISLAATLLLVMALIVSACGRGKPAESDIAADEATVAAPAAQEPAATATEEPTPSPTEAAQAADAAVVEGSQAAQSTELARH